MNHFLCYLDNFYWIHFFQKIALSSPLPLHIQLEFWL